MFALVEKMNPFASHLLSLLGGPRFQTLDVGDVLFRPRTSSHLS